MEHCPGIHQCWPSVPLFALPSNEERNSYEVSLVFVAIASDVLLLAKNIFQVGIKEPQVE